MNLEGTEDSASRFAAYIEELTSVIGHADRARPMNDYCAGLLVTEGRRSVEPIAAVTAPDKTSVQHQKLLHFVAEAPWSDEPVLVKVREMVVPLSIANHHASLPIAYRLYLPEEWAKDAARRKKARVPKAITFKTKPEIALEQIRKAYAAGVPRGAALIDASYGSNSALRTGISALGLKYVAAIIPTVKVRRVSDRGASDERLSAKELALSLPKHAWRTITWREGTNDKLRSRFARVRVRTAPIRGAAKRGEETLLIEWPVGEPQPTKYWLATVEKNISFRALVDLAKMRWRVERDYLELKQEVGLGHYEGRGWPGFHHHGTLCIAVYGFLISEREMIPPSGPHCAGKRKKPAIPDSYRPRGAADPAPTSRSQLDRHAASTLDRRDRKNAAKMSILRKQIQKEQAPCFLTKYD